jgi:hypothetical protein
MKRLLGKSLAFNLLALAFLGFAASSHRVSMDNVLDLGIGLSLCLSVLLVAREFHRRRRADD